MNRSYSMIIDSAKAPAGIREHNTSRIEQFVFMGDEILDRYPSERGKRWRGTTRKQQRNGALRLVVSSRLSGYPQTREAGIQPGSSRASPLNGVPSIFDLGPTESLLIHLKVELFFHQELEFVLDRAEIRPL